MAVQQTITKFRAMLGDCPWLLESKNIVHVPFRDPNAPRDRPSQTLPGVTWPELNELLDYAADLDGPRTGGIAAARVETEGVMSNVSPTDVERFSEHCVFIRSVYQLMVRLCRDSNSAERALMETIAPLFFKSLNIVFPTYMVIAACRITDPAKDRRGNENFTLEMFVNNFAPDTEAFKQLDAVHQRIKPFRTKIERARHKLGAHTDRAAVSGPPVFAGSWPEWEQFWSDLKDFVRILNEQTTGKAFDIDAPGVPGDVDMLLRALSQSQHTQGK
jgi:AbiU2